MSRLKEHRGSHGEAGRTGTEFQCRQRSHEPGPGDNLWALSWQRRSLGIPCTFLGQHRSAAFAARGSWSRPARGRQGSSGVGFWGAQAVGGCVAGPRRAALPGLRSRHRSGYLLWGSPRT